MPVEIKELVIKTVAMSEPTGSSPNAPRSLTPEEKEAIIDECVKQILRILKKSQER